jgi:hypothetical protein
MNEIYINIIEWADINYNNIEERPDIFPIKWHCKGLDKEDVQCRAGNINPSSQLTTKSRLNSSYWKKSSLDKLIESFNDAWNYSDQLIICVWNVTQKESEPPLGFISFSFKWEQTKTKKISYLEFTVNLIWVRPDKRGLGGVAARHIVAHLLCYLEDCKLTPPYVSAKGVDVTNYAEWHSSGGEKVTNLIDSYLLFMKSINIWKIRNLDYDGGY